nr:extensin-like [Penaeus vannamei]
MGRMSPPSADDRSHPDDTHRYAHHRTPSAHRTHTATRPPQDTPEHPHPPPSTPPPGPNTHHHSQTAAHAPQPHSHSNQPTPPPPDHNPPHLQPRPRPTTPHPTPPPTHTPKTKPLPPASLDPPMDLARLISGRKTPGTPKDRSCSLEAQAVDNVLQQPHHSLRGCGFTERLGQFRL